MNVKFLNIIYFKVLKHHNGSGTVTTLFQYLVITNIAKNPFFENKFFSKFIISKVML